MKNVARLIALVLAFSPWAQASQKNTASSSPPHKDRALTDDEKEMLKQRQLLENLELLQDFEKIRYLDFLAAPKTSKDKGKRASRQAAKDNESKKTKP